MRVSELQLIAAEPELDEEEMKIRIISLGTS